MDEVIDFGRLLHESPDLFPWVVLAIVIFVAYKERDTIRALIQGILESRKETAMYHAQHNELVRNNTAALQNNTAALELVKRDRELLLHVLEDHEKMSGERDQHIQTVVNRIDETLQNNRKDIVLMKDRIER